MKIGIIGKGAIGAYVRQQAIAQGFDVAVLVLRPGSTSQAIKSMDDIFCTDDIANLPSDIDYMIDCAGHAALRSMGPEILRRGYNLLTVSLGALADHDLFQLLEQAAIEGQSKLRLATGAIGALDCLQAANVGGLKQVTYIGRKPPLGWKGSPAEQSLDLENLGEGAHVHFEGSARKAALEYPKNANVAAAVALAGIGFDQTHVKLIADAGVTENIHQIQAEGEFGTFSFEIRGRALAGNPRSSALAAMSVLSQLQRESRHITF